MNNWKPLIIIPTLNERKNISSLIAEIRSKYSDIAIVIVDDNSIDGTREIADQLSLKYEGLQVIHRKKREGFGAAVIEGFKFALSKDFDPIITMDGDLSHDPSYLPDFLKFRKKFDLIIGSRYIGGVRVDGWRFRKLLVSKLANIFVAYVLVKPIWDFTSGFRVYSKRFLKSIDFDEIPYEGYIFQIHMVYKAYSLKLRVKEVPFLYKEEEYRGSKLPPGDIRKTFFKIFKYRAPLLEILRHFTYVRRDYHRFVSEYEELLSPPDLKRLHSINNGDKFKLSVGVMAYNEENNISKCLEAIEKQRLSISEIEEIIVVSSGSTDRTNEIVQNLHKENYKIKLVLQEKRYGKASAINEFLNAAKGDICILESADTLARPDTIEKLIKPFRNENVGITGAHPVPINNKRRFVGFCVNKLWQLHHLLALDNPKCGEMIAFRNILKKIPSYTAVDEAVIESLIRSQNYDAVYVSEAQLENKGPDNLKEFWKQRVRIVAGHKHLASTMGYKVSTYHPFKIFKYLLKDFNWSIREAVCTVGLIFFEASARLVGSLNFYFRDKNPYIWDIAKSTKIISSIN